MPRPRPNEDRRHAIKLYSSGLSYSMVAEQLRSSVDWVAKVVTRAGVKRNASAARRAYFDRGGKAPNRLGLPIPGIVREYLAGKSILAIADTLHVSSRPVRRILLEAGIPLRRHADALALIDRKQSSARAAQAKPNHVGWGEYLLQQLLAERGEFANAQFPVGSRNIDLAFHPIAVEVWLSSESPFHDPYCRQRIKYLADRGWTCVYVWIARRTRVLLPCVADQIVTVLQEARSNPASLGQHRVIRGCGELASVARDNIDRAPTIPPSKDCPYHSTANKR